MVFGVAALAGVGFTVALFIAELAFDSPRDVETGKLAVLVASLLASVFGAVILRWGNRFSSADDSGVESLRQLSQHRRES